MQRENALRLLNVAQQETQNMHALNRARNEIYRKIWDSRHRCAWIHHLVFKDNVRTKKRVGCSYGNLRKSFSIPLLSDQRKRPWRETNKCGVWQDNVQSDRLWCQENCALRCPGKLCLISPSSLFPFGPLNSLRVKYNAVPHHFVQELL